MTQELRNFMDNVSGDITKITQACTMNDKLTDKLMENTMSQALTKPQDVTTPVSPQILEHLEQIIHQIPLMKQIGPCPGKQITAAYHSNLIMMHITHTDLMRHVQLPIFYVNEKISYPTPFDFNQPIVELFRHQTKLTHSTQWLYQKTTAALENIAKSLSFQENQQFINDTPIFKAKDPQFFDDWLEQIDKVASLTNEDPCKLALAKSQGSFTRMISSFPPSMGMEQN